MISRKPSRDTLRRNVLGRTKSAAASGRENACETSGTMALCSSHEQPRTSVVGYSILLCSLPETGRRHRRDSPGRPRWIVQVQLALSALCSWKRSPL